MKFSNTAHMFTILWLPFILVGSSLIYFGLTSPNQMCGSAAFAVCPLKSLLNSKVNVPEHLDVHPKPRQVLDTTTHLEAGKTEWGLGRICVTYAKNLGNSFIRLNGRSLGLPDELEDGLMPAGPMYACWQAPTYLGYYQVELRFNNGQYQYYWWYEITN